MRNERPLLGAETMLSGRLLARRRHHRHLVHPPVEAEPDDTRTPRLREGAEGRETGGELPGQLALGHGMHDAVSLHVRHPAEEAQGDVPCGRSNGSAGQALQRRARSGGPQAAGGFPRRAPREEEPLLAQVAHGRLRGLQRSGTLPHQSPATASRARCSAAVVVYTRTRSRSPGMCNERAPACSGVRTATTMVPMERSSGPGRQSPSLRSTTSAPSRQQPPRPSRRLPARSPHRSFRSALQPRRGARP